MDFTFTFLLCYWLLILYCSFWPGFKVNVITKVCYVFYLFNKLRNKEDLSQWNIKNKYLCIYLPCRWHPLFYSESVNGQIWVSLHTESSLQSVLFVTEWLTCHSLTDAVLTLDQKSLSYSVCSVLSGYDYVTLFKLSDFECFMFLFYISVQTDQEINCVSMQ